MFLLASHLHWFLPCPHWRCSAAGQSEERGAAGVEESGPEGAAQRGTASPGKRAPWMWTIRGGLMLRLSSLSLTTRTGIECQEKQPLCQPGLTLRAKDRRQVISKQLFPPIGLFQLLFHVIPSVGFNGLNDKVRASVYWVGGYKAWIRLNTYWKQQTQGPPMLAWPPFCSPCLWGNYSPPLSLLPLFVSVPWEIQKQLLSKVWKDQRAPFCGVWNDYSYLSSHSFGFSHCETSVRQL